MILELLTTVVLAQPVSRAPVEEPEQVKAFATFLDHQLLSPDFDPTGLKIRQDERSYALLDEGFTTSFELVPDAFALAQKIQDNVRLSNALQIGGFSIMGSSLVLALAGPFLLGSGALLPLMAVSLGLVLVGAVVTLLSLPFATAAQTQFFTALDTYNKGLLHLRPQSITDAGGLQLPIP